MNYGMKYSSTRTSGTVDTEQGNLKNKKKKKKRKKKKKGKEKKTADSIT